MKNRIKIAFAAMVLLGSDIFAQNMANVRADIKSLCSKKMFGRGYLKEGDKKAAAYIAAEFKKTGLKPFGDDFYQKFEMAVNTFPKAAKLSVNGKKLDLGKDFILNPISESAKGQAEALYFPNIQAVKSSKHFQDGTLAGKALVMPIEVYQGFSKQLPIDYMKKAHSAAVIVALHKKLTHSVGYYSVQPPFFYALDASFPQDIQKISFSVTNRFIEKYPSQNVIGYMEGTENKESFLVFSAHYDHLGGIGNKTYFPGANDNAAGVAMLLELARFYKANPPKQSVAFMAFGAEEAGLIGSQYYVEHPLFPLDKIRFLLNLDLVGTGDEGMTAVNGSLFPNEYTRLDQLNTERKALPKLWARGKAANSDHYFFTEKGVPSFFIYLMGGIQAYHDTDDRPETLPLTKFKEFFQLMVDFSKGF